MSLPRILKFAVPASRDGVVIGAGKSLKLRSVGWQRGEVVVWAEVEDWRYEGIAPAPGGYHVVAVATGGERPPAHEYLGTVQGVEGDLVFHIYAMAIRGK